MWQSVKVLTSGAREQSDGHCPSAEKHMREPVARDVNGDVQQGWWCYVAEDK